MTDSKTELLPCPGGHKKVYQFDYDEHGNIICTECGWALSGLQYDPIIKGDDLRKAWNTRHDATREKVLAWVNTHRVAWVCEEIRELLKC